MKIRHQLLIAFLLISLCFLVGCSTDEIYLCNSCGEPNLTDVNVYNCTTRTTGETGYDYTTNDYYYCNTTTWVKLNNQSGGSSIINNTYYITNNFTVNNSTFQCSGTDKLSNVSIINGAITGVCTTDQTGTGGGVNFFDLIDRDYYYRNTGFESVTAGYNEPWVPTAIVGGTSAVGVGTVNHPGTSTLSCGNGANGGYAYQITGASTYLLGANYVSIGSFKVSTTGTWFNSSNLTANDTNVRFGFMDVFTVGAVTDGVFFNISHNLTNRTQLIIRGVARNNSVQATTPSSFAILNNTWFTYMIYINSPTLATFSVYNESQSLVWNDTVTSRIPTKTGFETSHGLVAWRQGNTTARVLVTVDYISVGINASIIR